jgi:predicted dehydrogenase
MSDKPLRVCIVGCGYMGNIHADCWSHVPEAEVVAVVDIIEERARQLAEKFGLERFYTDYREAIDLPQVNGVSVCIPTCLHADASVFAMQRGRHVLSEKPIALDLAQAEAMLAAARQSGVKFSVGLMRYHSPVMAELKQWLGNGRQNHPAIYWASDIREIRPKREMHDQHANGGPVIDMGVHLFATWLELFGSPAREVYAQGFTLAGERPELAHIPDKAVDSASVSVRFESGDVGNFLVTWGMPPGVVPPNMPEVILTANGVLNLTFSGNHQQASFQHEGGEWETIAVCEENMYQREINDFAAAILQDRPPLVSGEQGRAALQVALAALESIRSGLPVQI